MATIRTKIKMKSTESAYFKTTTKNARTHPTKRKAKHYDPIVRRHVEFKEEKVK